MLVKYIFLFVFFSFARQRSAASDIALDYYFGVDDPLRSVKYLENCNSRRTQEMCQLQCGPNHACLLGKCFCVNVISPITRNDDNGKSAPAKNRCNKLRTKLRVLDNFLEKLTCCNDRTDSSSGGDSSSRESESKQNGKNYIMADDMALRPSLRHHIAHFCPNLDIARKCIRKCIERRKPAFCGKDHVCYCGKRYDSHDDNQINNETYVPFKQLYKKYFGPQVDRKGPEEQPLNPTVSTDDPLVVQRLIELLIQNSSQSTLPEEIITATNINKTVSEVLGKIIQAEYDNDINNDYYNY